MVRQMGEVMERIKIRSRDHSEVGVRGLEAEIMERDKRIVNIADVGTKQGNIIIDPKRKRIEEHSTAEIHGDDEVEISND